MSSIAADEEDDCQLSKEIEDRFDEFFANPRPQPKLFDYDGNEILNLPPCSGCCDWCGSMDACENYCDDLHYYSYEHYQGWYSTVCAELAGYADEACRNDRS